MLPSWGTSGMALSVSTEFCYALDVFDATHVIMLYMGILYSVTSCVSVNADYSTAKQSLFGDHTL